MTAQLLNTTPETFVPKDDTTQTSGASANQRLSDQANDLLSDPALRASLRNPDNFYEAFKDAMPKLDLKGDRNITDSELKSFSTDPTQPLEQRVAAEIVHENLAALEKANPGQRLDLDFIRFVTNSIRPEVAADTFATDYADSIFRHGMRHVAASTTLAVGICSGSGFFIGGPPMAAFLGAGCGATNLLSTGEMLHHDTDIARSYATRLQLARPAVQRLNILDAAGSVIPN